MTINSLDAGRRDAIHSFLREGGWGDSERFPLIADASSRRYERLRRGNKTVLLMDAPPVAESDPCPPGASESERVTLGYNALARLAGPDARRFAAFSTELRLRGLSAPEVLYAKYDEGLLLIEDLGDALFARAIADGASERLLYEAAVDVLLELHERPAPDLLGGAAAPFAPLLDYDRLAYIAELDLLLEWFYPLVAGHTMSSDLVAEYREIWTELLDGILSADPVLVLRDYHAENVLWLPERLGVARVGLIDFQDGLRGHRAYDLVSLLEDARRDVSPDLADDMLERYLTGAKARRSDFDMQVFGVQSALLGCQRNAKILGIFARLWCRDGKPKYLRFIPRIWQYIERDLENPELAPLRVWFERVFPAHLRSAPAPV